MYNNYYYYVFLNIITIKANAEKAAASSEVEKMQRQVEDTANRLSTTEVLVDDLKKEIETIKEENMILSVKSRESESLVSSITEEKGNIQQLYSNILAEMEYSKKEVHYLTSEIETLKNSKGVPVTPKRTNRTNRSANNTNNTINTNDSEGDSMVSDDFSVLNLTPLSETRVQDIRPKRQESNSKNNTSKVLTYTERRPATNNDLISEHNNSLGESPVPSVPVTLETPGEMIEIDNGVSFKLKPSTSGDLYYVNQLNAQMDELRHSLSLKGMEMEASINDLNLVKDEKKKLEARIEELLAYLDRTKKLQEGDSAVNMEYLKNCIYRFMATNEVSEKKRLFPVIATILKLTSNENKQIEIALAVEENPIEVSAMKSFAESFGFKI